jgi:SSS family solute:Na+ symporter
MARNPMTRQGAFAGILVGVAVVAYVTLAHSTFVTLLPFLPAKADEINIGFAALILNVLAATGVSLATRPAAVMATSRPG